MKSIFEKLHRFFGAAWRLAVLDLEKGLWPVKARIEHLSYLKAQNAAGRHILMQPTQLQYYLLADDLCWSTVCRHHQRRDGSWKSGRMVVETSPHNFQVWIRCASALDLDQKRILLKMLLSDPAADPNNRFGRCPGFRNRKDRHRSLTGHYPLCRLIWVDLRSSAVIPHNLLHRHAMTHPRKVPHPPRRGFVCHQAVPPRSNYHRPDESRTDFAYALALARRGCADHLIRSLIADQRSCWLHHQGESRKNAYLDRTIAKARAIVNGSRDIQIPPVKSICSE